MNAKSSFNSAGFGAFVAHRSLPFGPRIAFNAPDDLGGAVSNAGAAENKATTPPVAEEKPVVQDKAAQGEKSQDKSRSDKEAELLREVMDKKNRIRDLETSVSQAQSELEKFKDIDIDQVRSLLAEKADRERQEAEARGEFDRVKQMMVEDHTKKVSDLESQLDALRQEVGKRDGVIDGLTIGNAFATSQLIGQELTLSPTKARIVYGTHFDIVDGKVVGYDKPAGSEGRTPLVDGTGSHLAFDAALRKIVESDPERDNIFRAQLQPGAQSKTQQVTTAESKGADNLFGASRIAAALAAGK